MPLYLWPVELFSVKTAKGSKTILNMWAKVGSEEQKWLVFDEGVEQGEPDGSVFRALVSESETGKPPPGASFTVIGTFWDQHVFDLGVSSMSEFLRGQAVVNARLVISKTSPLTVILTRGGADGVDPKNQPRLSEKDHLTLRLQEENAKGLRGDRLYGRLYAMDSDAAVWSAL